MVEWDGLENRCGLRSTEGSNPSLPARRKRVRKGTFLVPIMACIEKMRFESLPAHENLTGIVLKAIC